MTAEIVRLDDRFPRLVLERGYRDGMPIDVVTYHENGLGCVVWMTSDGGTAEAAAAAWAGSGARIIDLRGEATR